MLRGMLASRVAPKDPRQLDGVANALREILEAKESITSMRLDALDGLGHLLTLKPDIDWAPAQMTAISIRKIRIEVRSFCNSDMVSSRMS